MLEKMKQELMAKMKKGSKMSDMEKDAKLSILKDLSEQAGDKMAEKLKGAMSVKVASDSKEGLKKGLEKAESLLEKAEEGCDDATCGKPSCPMCGEHESEDSVEPSLEKEEEKSESDMSLEDLEEKIKELMKLKEAKVKM